MFQANINQPSLVQQQQQQQNIIKYHPFFRTPEEDPSSLSLVQISNSYDKSLEI